MSFQFVLFKKVLQYLGKNKINFIPNDSKALLSMKKVLLLLLLAGNVFADDTVYPDIEYDIPKSKWEKAPKFYSSGKCKDPMNLMELCKSKKLLEVEAKQKLFYETHKKCSKWKYVKLNESCDNKPSSADKKWKKTNH